MSPPPIPVRGPEMAGADHLRLRIEQQVCAAHLQGPALLALGRPLAQVGTAYSGQAVDAQGRRAVPEALRPLGPACSHTLAVAPQALVPTLNSLPDQAWDGLLALDLLGHSPDWHAGLAALHRLLKDGGRVVLDLAALEHLEVVQGSSLSTAPAPGPDGELPLRAADVLHAALGLGLQPLLLRPAAAFTGGPQTHPLVRSRTPEHLHWWLRLLSWIPQDESLSALALLLDEAVVARLGAGATRRCLLVLERRPEVDAQAAGALAQPPGLPQGEAAAALSSALNARLLAGPRELKYYTALRDALRALMPGLALDALVTGDARARLAEADHRTGLDAHAMDMIKGWRELPEPRALMTVAGVPLGDVHDYHMIQMLLIFGFNAFPGIKL